MARGRLVKRSEGSWSLVFDIPRGADGKRKQKRIAFRGTKKAAQAELTRLLHEAETGSFIEPSRQTTAQYLDKWLTGYKPRVRQLTWERYGLLIEKNIVPEIGHIPLTKLKPEDIRAAWSRLEENGRCDGKGGLSRHTVQHCHRVLRRALQMAVEDGRISRNPCDFERAKPPQVVRKEMLALDEAQTAMLLKAARGSWSYVPIVLAITTGIRRGEVLGLRWEDVDLAAATLSVTQAVYKAKENGIAFASPKTAKSRRMIDLPALAVDALREHRRETNRVAGLVFADEDGNPRTPLSLTSAFKNLVEKLGLPRVRLHDLRHSHASQLLKAGVNPKVVSERLGHSTVAFTLDIYSHVMPGMGKEAAHKINEALQKAMDGG